MRRIVGRACPDSSADTPIINASRTVRRALPAITERFKHWMIGVDGRAAVTLFVVPMALYRYRGVGRTD